METEIFEHMHLAPLYPSFEQQLVPIESYNDTKDESEPNPTSFRKIQLKYLKNKGIKIQTV